MTTHFGTAYSPQKFRTFNLGTPQLDWSLERSLRAPLSHALQSKGLDVQDVDDKLQAIKDQLFNKKIHEQIHQIYPRLQKIAQDSPIVIAPFARSRLLLLNPTGSETYNHVRDELLHINFDSPEANAFNTLSIISNILFELKTGLQIPQRRQFALTRKWVALQTHLSSIENIFPTQVSRWKRIVRANPNITQISRLISETVNTLSTNLMVMRNTILLIGQAVLDGSKKALTIYKHRVLKFLEERCQTCHRDYDFTAQEPFVEFLRKCAGCKTAIYCSKECQRIDWPSHKKVCQHSKLQ